MSDIEKLVEIIEEKVALKNEVEALRPQLKKALEERDMYKSGIKFALDVLNRVEGLPIGINERNSLRERIDVVKSFLEG